MLIYLSILFLFIAPLLNLLCLKKDYVFSSLQGFVFVMLASLISIEIIPELLEKAGVAVLFSLTLGLLLPSISEKIFHHNQFIHKAVILIGILGLVIHVLADGAVLAESALSTHDDVGTGLALAVAIHRIPIGLFIWWFIRPNFGSVIAYLMLFIIATGTITGYQLADRVYALMDYSDVIYFQAFVVGSLIHVLFHRPPIKERCASRHNLNQKAEGIGNILGLSCVFYLLKHAPHHHKAGYEAWVVEVVNTFNYLALETAPMLLFAIISAGLIKIFMPDSFINWIKHGKTWQQSFKGMIVGIPLPVCSCGVIPLYHSLITKGVPSSAAMAFLIATPELGIDAFLISLPLLGTELTFARLFSAVILAFSVGILASKFASPTVMHTHDEPFDDCCSKHEHEHNHSFTSKILKGIDYSLHEVLEHIAPWILVGIALAAILQPMIGNLHLEGISAELQVLILATLGIPLYVCASSTTPLVAILIMNGISPGAGLAFLLAGPATNISTFGVLSKIHNVQTALFLMVICFTISVSLGVAVNMLLSGIGYTSSIGLNHQHTIIHEISLSILVLLFLYTIFRKGLRSFLLELVPHTHSHNDPVCTHQH